MKNVCCSILLLLMLTSSFVWAAPIKVAFINPGHPHGDDTGSFWSNVNRFMQAAADDLEIELHSLYAERDNLLMKEQAKAVAQLSPDYVIVVNEKGIGPALVQTLAEHQLPIFTLLNSFNEEELAHLTQEQRSLIFGSLVPDNFVAGKQLMHSLFAIHQQKQPDAISYKLVALQGDFRSEAATERNNGLIVFLETQDNIQFIDSTVVSWSGEVAYQKIKGLLQRTRIDIIWAANDPIAMGARRAVNEAKLDYDVTIGGVNWDAPDKHLPLDISYGGHVLLGAKALIMIADYHAGLLADCEMQQKLDIFQPGTREEIITFHENSQGKNLAEFDFRRFSRVNPHPADFNLKTFVTRTYSPISKPPHITDCSDLAMF